MQYFPNLKQGDPINRRWFNDLIGFCNSLVLRGDGRTTRVSHGAGGTTVSTIPQPVAAGGSGGGGGREFVISPAGSGMVSVSSGWVEELLRPSNESVYVTEIAGRTFAIPSTSGNYSLFLVRHGNLNEYGTYNYVWGSDAGSKGITLLHGAVANYIGSVKVASGSVSEIKQLTQKRLLFDVRRSPFEVYARFSMTDGMMASAVTATEIVVNSGLCPKVSAYSSSPPSNTWSYVSSFSFDISEGEISAGSVIYLRITSSGGAFRAMASGYSSVNIPVWDNTNGVANIPIAYYSGSYILQYAVGLQYAVPLCDPN